MRLAFGGSVLRSVVAQNPPTRGRGYLVAALLRPTQCCKYVVWTTRHDDLRLGIEKTIEAGPWIGYEGSRTGGGLEKPNAGTVARIDHICARNVQRPAKTRIETRVIGRRKMGYMLDVRRPANR
jgi:hypothetical protein